MKTAGVTLRHLRGRGGGGGEEVLSQFISTHIS